MLQFLHQRDVFLILGIEPGRLGRSYTIIEAIRLLLEPVIPYIRSFSVALHSTFSLCRRGRGAPPKISRKRILNFFLYTLFYFSMIHGPSPFSCTLHMLSTFCTIACILHAQCLFFGWSTSFFFLFLTYIHTVNEFQEREPDDEDDSHVEYLQ
ncbi:hypothetical protein D1872_215890 [compost metagenome]